MRTSTSAGSWLRRPRGALSRVIGLAAVGLAAGGVILGTSGPAGPATAPRVPNVDRFGTVWLCRPGLAADPCTVRLTAAVVGPHGGTGVQRVRAAKNPPIDCFYVYPTVSPQSTPNANLSIDPAETAVASAQAARFSQVCRVYAPMYRQLTLKAIGGHGLSVISEATAYLSMLAGWKDYLAHYNHGRGVVLIGHSQGAALLIKLIESQVDPSPALRSRLVSAVLLGGNVTVAVGSDVGGSFRHVPACSGPSTVHCVIAYSSFLQPPPANSLFGRPGAGVSALSGQGGTTALQVLCVNPEVVGGGPLLPYFPTARFPGVIGQSTGTGLSRRTPWVTFPGLYSATCMDAGGASWLQIDVVAMPGDTRPTVTQSLGPAWGLHLVDVNIALGNLVDAVRSESAAYVRATPGRR